MIWVLPSPTCTPMPPRASTEYLLSAPARAGTGPAPSAGSELTGQPLAVSHREGDEEGSWCAKSGSPRSARAWDGPHLRGTLAGLGGAGHLQRLALCRGV